MNLFAHREEKVMSREIYCITDLIALGYPRQDLYEIARSEDFTDAGGFRGLGKRSKIYFNRHKLDTYLRRRTNER